MFTWLKNILGIGPSVPAAIEAAIPAPEEKPKTKTTATKKTSKKKGSGSCDFTKLTKPQLLAEAKHRGVKANASMKKADILAALKSSK